jgi:hypothetical protein
MTPDLLDGRGGFEEASRIGRGLAQKALQGLLNPQTRTARAALAFSSTTILVPVENSRYLLFLPALAFGHRLLDSSGQPLPVWKKYWLPLRHVFRRLEAAQRPWVESEVSVLDIGPARLLGIPGEIFPELVIGGYDGQFQAGHPLINPDNADPPDLKSAPKGPYLRGQIASPLKFIVGLANDELGYIIPEYDFKIQKSLSLLPRLPGHHYEETNSIGPSATGIIRQACERLLTVRSPLQPQTPRAGEKR